jgi:HEAT repeat protein
MSDLSLRPRAGRWIFVLILVATASILVAGGFWIRHERATHDPVYLIEHGGPFEQLQAAADLGVLKEDTDVDRVMAALETAIDTGEIVLRSTSEEALGGLTAQVLRERGDVGSVGRERTSRHVTFAIRKLTQGLSDPEPTIRASAAFALGRLAAASPVDLPSKLVEALEDESTAVRNASLKALTEAQLAPSIVPALIKSLASSNPEIRFRTAEILGRLGAAAEPAIPALIAMLAEPLEGNKDKDGAPMAVDWDPVCGAAIALGQIGAGKPAVASLTAMLSSKDAERASSAAAGLARMGPAAVKALPALITAYERVLRSDQHVIGQGALALALGAIGPRSPAAIEVLTILTRALDSKDQWVRINAVEALGNFGPDAKAVTARLREFEQSPVRELRDAARKSLALIERSSPAADVTPTEVKPAR